MPTWMGEIAEGPTLDEQLQVIKNNWEMGELVFRYKHPKVVSPKNNTYKQQQATFV